MEKVIVNMADITTVYDFLKDGESEAEAIKRGEDFYQAEMLRTWQLELDYPENKLFKSMSAKAWDNATAEIKVMNLDEYITLKNNSLLAGPVEEVTKEDFDEALNVLPPRKWCTHNNIEMFCMSEMHSGTITGQYAHDHNTDKYYYKLVNICDPSTWICELL